MVIVTKPAFVYSKIISNQLGLPGFARDFYCQLCLYVSLFLCISVSPLYLSWWLDLTPTDIFATDISTTTTLVPPIAKNNFFAPFAKNDISATFTFVPPTKIGNESPPVLVRSDCQYQRIKVQSLGVESWGMEVKPPSQGLRACLLGYSDQVRFFLSFFLKLKLSLISKPCIQSQF